MLKSMVLTPPTLPFSPSPLPHPYPRPHTLQPLDMYFGAFEVGVLFISSLIVSQVRVRVISEGEG